ncbi:MAG: tRNA threonylcarbamoyladenosine dehydratase [Lentisphaeria bacterium]|nr:tRNA threonylcarbamoyladenosine dehydratase [Lentisphaeria bacterium]
MPFSRLELLIGNDDLSKLRNARILLLGVGGVGSWTAEILARTAIGHLTLVDSDTVKPSNINRQVHALHSTLGRLKAEVMAERIHDINPSANVTPLNLHLTPENLPELLDNTPWSCVIDAIDERKPKFAAILHCLQHSIPILSSMGSANKVNPATVEITDISKTYGCPLAKLMRKALHKEGIQSGLKVCFSPELPSVLQNGGYHADEAENPGERKPLGTISYLPAIFGLRLAAEAIAMIQKQENHPPA